MKNIASYRMHRLITVRFTLFATLLSIAFAILIIAVISLPSLEIKTQNPLPSVIPVEKKEVEKLIAPAIVGEPAQMELIDVNGNNVINGKFEAIWPYVFGNSFVGGVFDKYDRLPYYMSNFVEFNIPSYMYKGFHNCGCSLTMPQSKDIRYNTKRIVREGYVLVIENSKFKFLRIDGKPGIGSIFQSAHHFSEGMAAVMLEGKWGYINTSGKMIVDPKYDEAYAFSDGIAVVGIDYKYGYIDNNGNPVTELKFDEVTFFQEGRSFVAKEVKITSGDKGYTYAHDNWAVINKSGELLTDFIFSELSKFENGQAIVEKENRYGVIDRDADVIIPFEFERIYSVSENLYACMEKSTSILFARDGNKIASVATRRIYPFSEGLAAIESEHTYDKIRFIDETGNVVFTREFGFDRFGFSDQPIGFFDGLAVVKVNSKFSYIDKTGAMVIPPQFSNANNFENGTAVVSTNYMNWIIDKSGKFLHKISSKSGLHCSRAKMKKDGKIGFTDSDGKIVIPAKYLLAMDFYEGHAIVHEQTKFNYVDELGNIAFEKSFDWAGEFIDNIALVKSNGKYEFINGKGENIFNRRFDKARPFSEGFATVSENGKWGYIDKSGEPAISCIFDKAWNFSSGVAVVKWQKFDYGTYSYTGKMVTGILKSNGELIELNFTEMLDYEYPGREIIFSEGLLPARKEKNGKWGYINTEGKFEIEPLFEKAHGFLNGFASVKDPDPKASYPKIMSIDKTGKRAIEGNVRTARTSQFGIAFSDQGSFKGSYFIGKDGDKIFDLPKGISARSIEDGYGIIINNDDECGVIDSTGKILIEPEYYSLRSLGYGLFACGYRYSRIINTKTDTVIDESLCFLGRFGKAIVWE